MCLGVPIAFSLGISSFIVLLIMGMNPITFIHRMVNSISSFSMLAVPFYILAGNLCSETGVTKRLVRLCQAYLGNIPGGTGLVNVMASVFFGGISGSAVADTAAIGGMLIPTMKEEGYESDFSSGITIASSTIGILIPPSIPLCLYGISAGVSIGAMFMAGFIPGILVALFQMIICFHLSKKKKYGTCKKSNASEKVSALRDAIWALGMPAIIFIGCGAGIVTASEAGVIAVVYSLIVGLFVYRELDITSIPRILVKSAKTSATALFIVGVASVVTWVINVDGIPALLVSVLTRISDNKYVLLVMINLILFAFGCFMDLVPLMLLFVPIFLPIVTMYGITPIQFGIIMTINLGIGLATPPVGNCLFVASGIAKLDGIKIFKASIPFLLCNILCLMLVQFVPPITMFLPTVFGVK